MGVGYLLKRLVLFVVVVWAAATFNFIVPRLSPRDPVAEKLTQLAAITQLAATSGVKQNEIVAMVAAYKARFGLDQPLWQQYLNYLWDFSHFDFGVSMSQFPTRVSDIILNALPWTIGLLSITTLLSFTIGSLLGALIARPRSSRWLRYALAPFMTLSSVPYYLVGLTLVYVLGVVFKLFPISGGYSTGAIPTLSVPFLLNVLHHSLLPAFSIIVIGLGGWALGMRGMMVTIEGEGYMLLAEANGLKPTTVFFHYALRNALLPQVTALALSLGFIISGSVLVEVVFRYPGVGSVLRDAISTADYFVIYGVVFMIVISISLATLILDLIYPLLDPRITYRRM
jgi:peptide/nickel transport system permease protein